jgi:hypothetical protein
MMTTTIPGTRDARGAGARTAGAGGLLGRRWEEAWQDQGGEKLAAICRGQQAKHRSLLQASKAWIEEEAMAEGRQTVPPAPGFQNSQRRFLRGQGVGHIGM